MRIATIVFASMLTLASTFALAQAGADRGEASGKAVATTKGGNAFNPARSGRSSGSAITTGSGAPRDNPNLSGSPETSDTSQKVK
jgi:hypothetical protein